MKKRLKAIKALIKNKKYLATVVLMAAVILISAFSIRSFPHPSSTAISGTPAQPTEISYNQFISKIDSKGISSVQYSKDNTRITGKLSDGTSFITDNPQTDSFKQYLLTHDVKLEPSKDTNNIFTELLKNALSLIMTLVIITFAFSYMSKRIISAQGRISSSGGSSFSVEKNYDVTFDNVAGNEEAKEDMAELVDFIKNPVKYKRYGATIPKGTILYGSPGTGKTLLAQALAGTAKVPFIAVSGSDFVEKYVGVGASRVRELFNIARKNSPCIVFIDEIDAVGKQRGGSMSGANDERDQTLNQLLVEMDGFTGSEGIIIIAATNRLDMLDEALLRSGRFDRQIQVELPDVEAREQILKIHSRNKPISSDVNLADVAKMTTYMSGADLKNVMNEASIYAARAGHSGITMRDIDKAINKIIAGEEKKNHKNDNRKDKEITAYHEAGHAIVAKLLTRKSVPKVTIIPTTKGAGGYTMINPEDERKFETKEDMLNDIAVSLGGRIAEEIIFGEDKITGGAYQDLINVTKKATAMVKYYGMSKEIGLINLQELYGNNFIGNTNDLLAKEVRSIVDSRYEYTKMLLEENKSILFNMAKALLERETIFENDVNVLIEGGVLETTPKLPKESKMRVAETLLQEDAV